MRFGLVLILAGLMGGALAAPSPAVETGRAFLWTGTHWQQVSEEAKTGYIFGMGNMADFEVAASRGRKPAGISTAFVDDLKSRTVQQIVQEVDKFYKENPGKLDTPVIEVVMRRCTKLCPPETSRGGDKQ